MKTGFHFDAPRGKYQCDAAIVWCFDNRFHLGLAKYLKRLDILTCDLIKVVGVAKCLASPGAKVTANLSLNRLGNPSGFTAQSWSS